MYQLTEVQRKGLIRHCFYPRTNPEIISVFLIMPWFTVPVCLTIEQLPLQSCQIYNMLDRYNELYPENVMKWNETNLQN